MYRYEALREVHIELTSRCNASCPQCPRNLSGGEVNPALPMAELALDDVKRLFPTELLERLRKLYACGNYGDPMIAKDTVAIFEHLRRENRTMELGMFTNGSGRTRAFWTDLASVVSYVRFSIDGLEDTNHLYRRGTQWGRIMESIEAFVAAGGRAEWDFIVFKHNEHQIEAARELASKLGFKRFFVKRTSRFFSPPKPGAGRASPDVPGTASREVKDRDGQSAYVIEEPDNPLFKNPAVVRLKQVDRFTDYQAATEIACKAEAQKRLYVSAEGLVFPCCWTGLSIRPVVREGPPRSGTSSDVSLKGRARSTVARGPFARSSRGRSSRSLSRQAGSHGP